MSFNGVRTGVSIALIGVLAGGGGAYAAGQVTGSQIKDGTITSKDIKRGTISPANLSAAARAGMVGPAGPAGAPGPAGPAGELAPSVFGSPGAVGAAGPAGPAGPKGDTGATGPAGAKGDPGAPGAKGDVGTAGAAGPAGTTGPPGAAGAPGATGPAGPSGATGGQGPKGDRGEAGLGAVTQVSVTVPNPPIDDTHFTATAVATCPNGTRVISGGYEHDTESLGEVYENRPDATSTSWIVSAANYAPLDPSSTASLTAYGFCAASSTASTAPYEQRRAAALQQAQALTDHAKKRR